MANGLVWADMTIAQVNAEAKKRGIPVREKNRGTEHLCNFCTQPIVAGQSYINPTKGFQIHAYHSEDGDLDCSPSNGGRSNGKRRTTRSKSGTPSNISSYVGDENLKQSQEDGYKEANDIVKIEIPADPALAQYIGRLEGYREAQEHILETQRSLLAEIKSFIQIFVDK